MDPSEQEREQFKAQLQAELESHKAALQQGVKAYEATLANSLAHWTETETRNRQAWLALAEHQRASFRAVIDFASLGIRSLILVNGGAIIGILTFLGNLWTKDDAAAKATAAAVAPALSFFIIGLTLALATSLLAYVAQVGFTEFVREGKPPLWAVISRIAGLLFAIFSAASMAVGAALCIGEQ